MPTTAGTWNFPVPTLPDPNNPPSDFAALAVAVSNSLTSATANTGWVTSGLSIAIESGWTLGGYCLYRNSAGWISGCLGVSYNAKLTPGAGGNFADLSILTLPPEWRTTCPIAIQTFGSQSGVATVFGRIANDGVLRVTHGIPGAEIPAAAAITFPIAYQD